MALTLEPALKPAAANQNITLEDFLDQMDRIQPAQTPLTSFAANEINLKATERSWNIDVYPNPAGALGRADGEAAGTAYDWSTNMRKMGNIMQGFSRQWGVGWIAEKVPHVAGVRDVLSYAKASAAVMLKVDMEVAFSSMDQYAVIDQGPGLGAITAPYRKLIDATNGYGNASSYVAGKPPGTASANTWASPTAACYTGTAAMTATVTRSFLKTVSKALRTAAKQNTDWTLIAGLSLRQAITDLTEPQTSSTTVTAGGVAEVATQIKVLSRAEQESTLGTSIDVIQTDFGRFMVVPTDYIGTTTTDVSGSALSGWASISGTGAGGRGLAAFVNNANAGLVLKKGNLFKSWGIAPYTVELSQTGAGDSYDTKCGVTLGVRNPILGAFWNFTS